MFGQMIGLAAQSYLDNFEHGQNMTLDPSFFAVDDDAAAFGSMLDDFVAEHIEENRADDIEVGPAVPKSSYPNSTL